MSVDIAQSERDSLWVCSIEGLSERTLKRFQKDLKETSEGLRDNFHQFLADLAIVYHRHRNEIFTRLNQAQTRSVPTAHLRAEIEKMFNEIGSVFTARGERIADAVRRTEYLATARL